MSTRTVFISGFLLILLELLFLSGTGCNLFAPQRQDSRITPGREAGRMEDAQELVRSYMDARLAEVGEEELNAYLTEEARGDYQGRSGMTLTGTAEVPLLGYRIFESSKVTPGEFGFSTAIQTSATNRPEAENLREDIIVRVIEEEYRVSSSRFLGRSSVRVRQSALIWEKDNITRTLMSLNDLPAEFSPIGSKGARFGAGREGFTTLAIRPDDKEVAFATWGVHGLIGVVSTTQQSSPTVLDLFFEGQAKLMAYSTTGDYLAVEEAAPTGSSRLRVYRVRGRRLVDLGLTQVFPPDRYHLNISRWESDGKTLLIRVNRFNQDAVEDKLGTWAVDIESGERQKVIL